MYKVNLEGDSKLKMLSDEMFRFTMDFVRYSLARRGLPDDIIPITHFRSLHFKPEIGRKIFQICDDKRDMFYEALEKVPRYVKLGYLLQKFGSHMFPDTASYNHYKFAHFLYFCGVCASYFAEKGKDEKAIRVSDTCAHFIISHFLMYFKVHGIYKHFVKYCLNYVPPV